MRLVLFLASVLLAVPLPTAAQRLRLPVGRRELERRAAQDSNDAAAHYNLALGYWKDRRWDDVERALDVANSIEFRFADAHLARSFLVTARMPDLVEQAERDDDTTVIAEATQLREREYRLAIMFDPFVDHKLAAAIPRRRVRPSQRGQFLLAQLLVFFALPSGFLQALDDLAEGRDERAYERLTELLAEYPTPTEVPEDVLWFHAIAAERIGHLDDAITDVQQLMSRSESVARDSTVLTPLRTNEYRYILATLRLRAGQEAMAEGLFRDVLAEDLGLYMAHVRLADLYAGQQRWNNALQHRRVALDLNPVDPTLLLELGVTLGQAGEMLEADSVLAAAERAAPRDSRVPYYRGVVAVAAERLEVARAAFERFLVLAPSRYERQIEIARRRLNELR